MNNRIIFKRIAALTAIVSVPIALSSWVLVALAAGSDPEVLSDLTNVITLGSRAARFLRLAWMFADTFGHSLLLMPAALYLWHWLKPQSSKLATLFTIAGLAFILTGAISVSLLGGLVPPVMNAYAVASESQRELITVVFESVFNMLFYGMGAVSFLLGGLWWLGIGNILRREQRILGIATMILGVLTLSIWLELALRLEVLAFLEVPQSFASYIWVVWLGIIIWRRDEQDIPSMEPATVT